MKTPLEVYQGSDGAATRELYFLLTDAGPIGFIVMNLFRATKCSERAKLYTRGKYRLDAYERKSWSMGNLTTCLTTHGAELGMGWGWKQDPNTVFDNQPSWVLYIDTPHGQVSFHSPTRGVGPEYAGEWDGKRGLTVQRVIDFATAVLTQLERAQVSA